MRVSWQLLSTFNFWKEDWALGCVSTLIWHFSNISQFPKILSLTSFSNSWGNSWIKFVMLDIKYRFPCGESEISEIIQKCQIWWCSKIVKNCQNIIARIAWELSFTLYPSNDDTNFWKNYQFWFENVSSFRKQLVGKIQSFLNANFYLTPKIQNSAHTKELNSELLTELTCFIYRSWMEKCFEVTEKIQKFKCEGNWAKLRPKNSFFDTLKLDKNSKM